MAIGAVGRSALRRPLGVWRQLPHQSWSPCGGRLRYATTPPSHEVVYSTPSPWIDMKATQCLALGLGFNGLVIAGITLTVHPVGWAAALPGAMLAASVYGMYHLEGALRSTVLRLRLYREPGPSPSGPAARRFTHLEVQTPKSIGLTDVAILRIPLDEIEFVGAESHPHVARGFIWRLLKAKRSARVLVLGVQLGPEFDEALEVARQTSPGFHRLRVRGTWDKRWEYAPFPEGSAAAAAHPPPVPPPPRT